MPRSRLWNYRPRKRGTAPWPESALMIAFAGVFCVVPWEMPSAIRWSSGRGRRSWLVAVLPCRQSWRGAEWLAAAPDFNEAYDCKHSAQSGEQPVGEAQWESPRTGSFVPTKEQGQHDTKGCDGYQRRSRSQLGMSVLANRSHLSLREIGVRQVLGCAQTRARHHCGSSCARRMRRFPPLAPLVPFPTKLSAKRRASL